VRAARALSEDEGAATSAAVEPVLVSVVIGVRNAVGSIQRCLDSVFAQTLVDTELVVIDGASTDGTRQVIERNADRIAIWLSEPDRGVYSAWNKALDHANGEWICFLGADDELDRPDVLSRMAVHLREATGHRTVVYGSVAMVDSSGVVVRTIGRSWPEIELEFREHMAIPHQGVFHHRDLFARHGRFDDRLRIAGDYELLLREVGVIPPLFVPGIVVTRMAAGGMSDSPRTRGRILRERYRVRRQHGLEPVPEWRAFGLQRSLVHAWLLKTLGANVADGVGGIYRAVARLPKHRSKR
jgi:glycosyltransferase involved in cell wall biosynthesis